MKKKIRRKREPDVLERVVLPLLLVVFFGAIALFWSNISWVVNGNVWRQFLSDSFPRFFPRPYVMIDKTSRPVIEPLGGAEPAITAVPGANSATTTVKAPDKPRKDLITIPKLGISAPIITSQTTDDKIVYSLLDDGAVLYPGSMPFGQTGQTVILGHSSPAGWPKLKYNWIFSRVNELEAGDMIVITYNYETRYYQVVKTRVVTPQEGVPEPTVTGNSLAIVSCWPPGKDLKRIIVESTIINR